MGTVPGTTGVDESAGSLGPMPMPAPAPRPAVRRSRAGWWGLAVLIGLTVAGQVGLIVAVANRLRGGSVGAGTHGRPPGSGSAGDQATGDLAVRRDAGAEPRSSFPGQDPPRDRRVPASAGLPEAPQSAVDAAGRRPAASMLAEARPGPERPAAVATDRPAGDVRSLGRELFARTWLPNDPRCPGGDGLGPVYNATSCLDCHNQGGPGGGGPAARNVQLVAGIGYMVVVGDTSAVVDRRGNGMAGLDQTADRADVAKVHPAFRDARSAVLHRFGVDPDYSRWHAAFLGRCRTTPPVTRAEIVALVTSTNSTRHSGRRHRTVQDRELEATVRDVENGLGSDRVAFRLTARNTPPLFGAGLIDGLSESDFVQAAKDQPEEIRGRVHWLKDGRLGRFGWKAQVASLEDFVLTACANEMGLEVPGHHQAISPLAPDTQARGLDLTGDECAALVAYVRSLPRPVSLDSSDTPTAAGVAEGRKLFDSVGCAGCHTADLGSIQGIYSDLLLHDMGPRLSDSGAYYGDDSELAGSVTPSEWRTPPLWGFRDTAPYLHDGRARTLAEAVAMHHGQGEASASRFHRLSARERSQVEAFLNSLAAPATPGSPRDAAGAARPVATQAGADPTSPAHAADRRGSMLGGS